MTTPSKLPKNAHDDARQHGLTITRAAWASLFCLLLMACSSPVSQTSSAPAPPGRCQASQLSLTLDDGNGRFNGMSHSGTSLVLRNTGTAACTLPTMLQPGFTDADGQALALAAQASTGTQAETAPTMLLATGARAGSDMRWVSGNVYDHGHCVSPVAISLNVDGQALRSRFAGHLCGPGGQPPGYTLTPLRPLAAAAGKSVAYACADGRTVQAAYPDSDTAVLTLDGRTFRLRTAVSADGARYVGDRWQWWTKGMHEGQLAPLKTGEKIASAIGVSCTVR